MKRYLVLHEPKMTGRPRHRGGSSMGIPTECEGTITIAELDQDCRSLRTALRHAPTGRKAFLAPANSSVYQTYRHLNDQLADCRANGQAARPTPTPLGAALTGHTDAGRPVPVWPWSWRFSLLDRLSSRSRLCGLRRGSGQLVYGM